MAIIPKTFVLTLFCSGTSKLLELGQTQLLTTSPSQYALALPEKREPRVTAAPDYRRHSCYSYTVTTPYTGVGRFQAAHISVIFFKWGGAKNSTVNCPVIPAHCPPHPDCVLLKTDTLKVPCKDPRCPTTPTVRVTGPAGCPTCQSGCATEVVTETVTTGCTVYTPL
jgi:hypothetical protein